VETRHSAEQASTKKVYTSPKLEIYGDLSSITEHTNNGHPHPDGGSPAFYNRT